MVHFHPDEAQLAEYVNGSLDFGVSICISAHLEYCPVCAAKVQQMLQVGANLLQESQAMDIPDNMEQALLDRIDSQALSGFEKQEAVANDARHSDLPSVVQKMISNHELEWKKLSLSLEAARLKSDQDQYELALHRIRAGQRVIEHGHRGDEYTVVLRGSFSDHYGRYNAGDFVHRTGEDTHQPVASEDLDCLCLTAVSEPIRLTGMLSVFNPLLKIHPQ